MGMQSVLNRSFSFQAFDMESWRAVSLLGVLQGRLFRFVVYLLGETIPQIWAQVFVLTVSFSLSGVLDHQTLASILLSCFFAAKGIYGETQKIETLYYFRRFCSAAVPCATMDKIFESFWVIIRIAPGFLFIAVGQLMTLMTLLFLSPRDNADDAVGQLMTLMTLMTLLILAIMRAVQPLRE